MNNVEWGLIRAFLAVARLGSLSAAARELALSQPTLSREIQSLERTTGLNLFKRTTQGLQLTESGHALVESATQMEQSAQKFDRLASGLSEELEGEVRISANEVVGYYMLPAALAAFRRQHPGVNVEVVISNRASSLNKREADIALRMFRPSQPDLVARRLPDLSLGFFAHRDYLAEHDHPESLPELASHTLIGFDHDMQMVESAGELGMVVSRDDFALRTDSMLMQIALMRAAAGIGVTHIGIATHYPELQQLLPKVVLPPLEFWTVCHSDVQYNSRIREMMLFLSEWFNNDPYRNHPS